MHLPVISSQYESATVANNFLRPATRRKLAIFLFAVNVVALIVIIKVSPWQTGDSARYIALATEIRHSKHFGLMTQNGWEPEGWRPPGYPLFLAIVQAVFGTSQTPVILIQGFMFLVALYLFWRVTNEIFGARTGLVFLAISAIYPFIAYAAAQIMAESAAVLLVALTFFCLLRPTLLRLALSGITSGAVAYFRPNMLLLVIAIAFALLLSSRRFLASATLMVVCAASVLIPWSIRNLFVFGDFVPLPVITGSGSSLFLATWQPNISQAALMQYGMRNQVGAEMVASGMAQQIIYVNGLVGVPADTNVLSPESYPGNANKIRADHLLREVALTNIRSQPESYAIKHVAWNFVRMWFPVGALERLPIFGRIFLLLDGVLVFLAGLAGAGLALGGRIKSSSWLTYSALATLLYSCLALCWFHTEGRYTVPVRFLLLVFAAKGVIALVDFIPSLMTKEWETREAA